MEGKKDCKFCPALRCKQLEPRGSAESSLDEFVSEIASGFTGGNTTDVSNFPESRYVSFVNVLCPISFAIKFWPCGSFDF